MDINQFTDFLIKSIVEGVQKAPPKPVTVMRAGNKVQTTNLAQLMSELSDQMIIANNLKREELKLKVDELKLLEEQIEAIEENTEVGKKNLSRGKRRRDNDDDGD